jgi:hypothetical protein
MSAVNPDSFLYPGIQVYKYVVLDYVHNKPWELNEEFKKKEKKNNKLKEKRLAGTLYSSLYMIYHPQPCLQGCTESWLGPVDLLRDWVGSIFSIRYAETQT